MKASNCIFALAAASVCALSLAFGGCVIVTPPHSAFRPIHQYAEDGNAALVAADLATNKEDLNLPDDAGLAPLHLAAMHCRTNVLALLLTAGAKVNLKAKGGATALHFAAQEGCVAGIDLLLKYGAMVNARDGDGQTPLKRAELWRQTNAAEDLHQHGGAE